MSAVQTDYDGPSGYRLVSSAWARAWAFKKPLLVSEWAEKNRRLSGKSAAEPGPWRNSRIPFLVEIMDELSDESLAQIVVFIKSAQVGATSCALNWIGWTIEHSPAPTMVLFPGEKMGEAWSRGPLQQMLVETPTLRRIIPPGRRNDNNNTLMEKDFPNGKIYIRSANIASDLASITVKRLLLDEVDRFPFELENEGDPVSLAIRRTATFGYRRKVFINSTPTIESLSRINQWWKESDQRHYHVPCPHCNELQYLKWDNLRWPEGHPEQAKYVCEKNGCVIEEHHKTWMLDPKNGARWIADHPERKTAVGFHVNCLYTPIGLGDTWAENAAVYDQVKREPAKLKVFRNTRLGETHEDPREKLEWETLHERREPYRLRSIPKGVLILTAGVDVQRDRLEVQLLGWTRKEFAWVLDYMVFPGDPTRDQPTYDEQGNEVPSVWERVDEYLQTEIANSYGVPMRIAATAVDSGYLQHEVTNFTRRRKGRNVFATKGFDIAGRPIIGQPKLVDVNWRGKLWKAGAEQYPVGASTAKQTLYERLRADEKALISDRHVHFPEALPEEYFRQLTAETFDPNKHRGWVKTYERNEALDTFILCMVAAMHHSVQVHRLRDHDWDRYEQMYEPKEGYKKDAVRPPAAVIGGFMPTRADVKRS